MKESNMVDNCEYSINQGFFTWELPSSERVGLVVVKELVMGSTLLRPRRPYNRQQQLWRRIHFQTVHRSHKLQRYQLQQQQVLHRKFQQLLLPLLHQQPKLLLKRLPASQLQKTSLPVLKHQAVQKAQLWRRQLALQLKLKHLEPGNLEQ